MAATQHEGFEEKALYVYLENELGSDDRKLSHYLDILVRRGRIRVQEVAGKRFYLVLAKEAEQREEREEGQTPIERPSVESELSEEEKRILLAQPVAQAPTSYIHTHAQTQEGSA